MSEATIFIKEATNEKDIQEVEYLINQLEGVERVLIDTVDGEVKVEFDDQVVSKEDILSILKDNHYQI
ncbi:hypothetical protein [Bacillus sinesaloumensis]|uniref:hypothetical protein n=1 Tax=Litchfieldia sinesaloumensis TaxID=1926280 RepID=UPI0009885122|nr:hypothetical protein [Bacillus sinesaloumensis]